MKIPKQMTVTQLKKYTANQLIDFAINALKALKTMIKTTKKKIHAHPHSTTKAHTPHKRGRKIIYTKAGKKSAEAQFRTHKKRMDALYGKNPKSKKKADAKRKSLATRRFNLGLSKSVWKNGRIVKFNGEVKAKSTAKPTNGRRRGQKIRKFLDPITKRYIFARPLG